MNIHYLQLASEPFNSIILGSKTIESRLFDEKRQQIQLGDTLIFTNREAPDQTQEVEVIGLLRYRTFHDLFTHNDSAKFGGESVDWLENQINDFYSLEQQHIRGVVGIEFKLV
jgi:ASC-1-like (ASCH) protein